MSDRQINPPPTPLECVHSPCPFRERIVALELRSDFLERARSDFETRLRAIERAIYLATGALALLQVVLRFFK